MTRKTSSRRSRKGSLMLPGAHRVAFQRAGAWRIYWYTHRGRGAACIWSGSGKTREAAEALERAQTGKIAEQYGQMTGPRSAHGFVSGLITDFKASPDWSGLADSTRKQWADHLDRIRDVFGDTSLAAMQQRGSRKLIKAWHQGMSSTPRAANIALTVLVRLFEFGVDEEDMARNPALNISRLDEGPGRADIIWTDEEFARLIAECKPHMARALRLAWLTGLRREDLVRLRWDQVDMAGSMIRRPTLKSRRKRTAYIEIGSELRALLEEMPKTAVQVVTRADGGSFTSAESFSKALKRPMDRANVMDELGRRKHLHDMRGTLATRKFADENFTDVDAENLFAWAPGSGAKMRGVYGDAESIALGRQKRLQEQGR